MLIINFTISVTWFENDPPLQNHVHRFASQGNIYINRTYRTDLELLAEAILMGNSTQSPLASKLVDMHLPNCPQAYLPNMGHLAVLIAVPLLHSPTPLNHINCCTLTPFQRAHHNCNIISEYSPPPPLCTKSPLPPALQRMEVEWSYF